MVIMMCKASRSHFRSPYRSPPSSNNSRCLGLFNQVFLGDCRQPRDLDRQMAAGGQHEVCCIGGLKGGGLLAQCCRSSREAAQCLEPIAGSPWHTEGPGGFNLAQKAWVRTERQAARRRLDLCGEGQAKLRNRHWYQPTCQRQSST